MLRVDHARWDQTPADLRRLAMSASHRRTRERFLALYEITQESCATRVAAQARRYPQTVMEWLHLYNTRGPEALVYQRTGGPPHMMVWTVERTNLRQNHTVSMTQPEGLFLPGSEDLAERPSIGR